MKRGVWLGGLGGLVLSLGGCAARLVAEDVDWHAVAPQPAPVTLTGAELIPCPAGPAASLGRPIAIARPVPPAAPGSPQLAPVSFETPAAPAPAKQTPPALPTWSEVTGNPPDEPGLIEEVTGFASEHGAPASGTPASGTLTGSATQTVQDVTGTPELGPVPKKAPDSNPAPLPTGFYPAPASVVAPVDGPVPDPLHCHYFVTAEYLAWALRSYHIPPLVTTGSVGSPVAGVLGQDSTRILLGDSDLGGNLRSGLRLTAGTWFDMWQEDGIQASVFYLGQKTDHFSTNTAQNPVIARPFFELNTGQQNVEFVSFPGLATGSIAVNAPSRFFGAEADYRTKLCCGCDYRVDLIAGFRFLDLDEDLNIAENIALSDAATLGPQINQGDLRNQTAAAFDDFHTKNRFYGGQIGIDGTKCWGSWSLEGKFKLALGATSEEVIVNGEQTFLPNSALNKPGDLLALPSNIGSQTRTRFSVVPELDLNIGYQLTDHMRAFIGYNFLYWSDVVRPGDQIDTVLDAATIPNFALKNGEQSTGQNRPTVPFKESGFWAQGLDVGIEFRY